MKTNVSIVIVHFGDIKTTINCINSILKKSVDFYKIYIVNNTNKNISKNYFKSKDIYLIENRANLGFSRAVNIGIKEALNDGAKYIMLLNNDTLIEKLNFKELIKSAPPKGIIGTAIKFNRKGKVIYDLGGKLNRLFGKTSHVEKHSLPRPFIIKRDYVSGCCMVIPASVFNKIGFFNEDYFLYYEDVEFCIKAGINGFPTYLHPGQTIFHLLSHSTSDNKKFAIFHQARSAIIFGLKNLDFPILNTFFVLIQSMALFLKKPELGISSLSGMKDGYMFMMRNMKYYKR